MAEMKAGRLRYLEILGCLGPQDRRRVCNFKRRSCLLFFALSSFRFFGFLGTVRDIKTSRPLLVASLESVRPFNLVS
jgi:hypothetical protein